MKNIKIFLSITIFTLFVFIMPKGAKAAETGNYSYEIVNREAVITKYINNEIYYDGLASIPETLGGYQVSSIDKGAFANCSDVKQVIIPEGVKNIGDFAFTGCRNLYSVTIPKSVTNIGEFAFANCRFLSIVNMPETGIINIGQRAFESCYSLQTIKLPSSVKSIGFGAFRFSSLSEVVIPEGINSIEPNVFEGCSSMKTLTLPSGLEDIKAGAFSGCSSLEAINALSLTAPEIESDAFAYVPSSAVLNIPEGASGYDIMPWIEWLNQDTVSLDSIECTSGGNILCNMIYKCFV
ncbi:MAG: leucine-rich repeat domain-containing protein [Solirubrobacterales bacterium]